MAIVFTYTPATNVVVVTGGTEATPATFADFVTADRAGTFVLRAAIATALNITLTNQPRPCEKLALKIDFVLAGTNAGAGDTIDITGTDAWDNAQVESIDVAAGNGVYESAKYWRTITDIDCTGFADGVGTIDAVQGQWGVIWDYTNYFILDAIFYIGDGATPTYFADKNKVIDMGPKLASVGYAMLIYKNATLRLGTLIDATLKTTKDPCILRWLNPTGVGQYLMAGGSSTIYLYSCSFLGKGLYANRCQVGGVFERAWNCSLYNEIAFEPQGVDGNFYNIDSFNCNVSYSNLRGTMNYIRSGNPLHYYFSCAYGGTVSNVVCKGTGLTFCRLLSLQNGDINFINPVSDTFVHTWQGVNTKNSNLKFTCDINVCDKDGVAISGAVVDCEDQFGDPVWAAGTETTDVSGNITQQIITYRRHYPISNVDTIQTYSPHKFTISKAGYETIVLDAITVDAPIVWHLELLPALSEDDVRDGVVFSEDSEGNLELPSIDDVEDGVSFGAGGVEFEGVLEVPAVDDVEDGIGYGANGIEFEGVLEIPVVADVEDGVGYGANGTEFEGVLEIPPIEDVEDGVGYGANGVEFEGVLEMPTENEVVVGVGYGANGIEFTGTCPILRGENLTAVLEESVDLVGHLEQRVDLTGELRP